MNVCPERPALLDHFSNQTEKLPPELRTHLEHCPDCLAAVENALGGTRLGMGTPTEIRTRGTAPGRVAPALSTSDSWPVLDRARDMTRRELGLDSD
jgi:hypothetical protein